MEANDEKISCIDPTDLDNDFEEQTSEQQLQNFRYLRKKELLTVLGVSRSKFDALVSEGIMPEAYKLGKRTVCWRSDEVYAALKTLPRRDSASPC